ncbi:hypothetical protein EVAR_43998_1 [Eumeta japonica]|uniref:Uncharacterized protein n=1 Tax=Eumeta variegata TaxID=151549 RepID=A0A4C1XH48_EUMVA|nr:hypothetical protein EVAR_43998_1 [Eumeta japonica]
MLTPFFPVKNMLLTSYDFQTKLLLQPAARASTTCPPPRSADRLCSTPLSVQLPMIQSFVWCFARTGIDEGPVGVEFGLLVVDIMEKHKAGFVDSLNTIYSEKHIKQFTRGIIQKAAAAGAGPGRGASARKRTRTPNPFARSITTRSNAGLIRALIVLYSQRSNFVS